MKSSGFVSFILLDKKPTMILGKMVALPLNALIHLAKREIRIKQTPVSIETYGLTRNHDSLLLSIFDTTKFYHTMNNLKLAQVRFRHSKNFAVAEIDSGFECGICTDLLINCRVICKEGHTICGMCLQHLNSNTCPYCRSPILANPPSNLQLESIIQNQYPKKYAEKYRELTGNNPSNWRSDSMFNGSTIFY
jgi:hypothetical protein